jgi:hypothetical protein
VILRSTKLPLPPEASARSGAPAPQPRHNAAYWAERTQGFDFSVEDQLDSERFNLILWNGLKGESEPYPDERDGRDLRKNRADFLRGSGKTRNR